MKQLTHGSLFAGIGGFDLGFERAGIKTVWQVEIDPFCRKVLERHFPDARRYHNIKRVKRFTPVDIISGGFPCQDISNAGRRRGIDGKRSGLWAEMWRVIRIVRPRFVVVENVAALLGRGVGRVFGDLAAVGYDAEWDCLPACAFGAPHQRDRVWILAYPMRRSGCAEPGQKQSERTAITDSGCARDVANSQRIAREVRESAQERSRGLAGGGEDVADSESPEVGSRPGEIYAGTEPKEANRFGNSYAAYGRHWATEPDVGRVAHGIPARVDRLKGLGNAVVPQIAEWIGRRIVTISA